MAFEKGIDVARFNELDDSWVQTGGLWTRCVFIGEKNSPDSPVGVAIKSGSRRSAIMSPARRSFDTTTMTVLLSGSVHA